jgi:NAD(P)H-dependent flavin oxidoreductase YrpB (nitropropane dioxygenase family)
MKTILLFVPDLFFSTKIEDAARELKLAVETVPANADFDAVIAKVDPTIVLLTFDRTGEAWEELASAARRAGIRVFAFGSHKNVNAFKRAKELGCEQVVANSRFSAEIPKLLQEWAK